MDNRITALEAMLQQDSQNSFVHYSLAMEYAKAGRLEHAVAAFRKLIEVNPDYAAAYYHAGQTLERLGDLDAAREMYEKGIAVTTRTGDAHTRSELQAALDVLPI
jgi:tetratricopeptide (TPR) repeat protein